MKIKDDIGTNIDLTEVAVFGRYVEPAKETLLWDNLNEDPRPRGDTVMVTMKSGASIPLKIDKERYDTILNLWMAI
jgi:hypothetical protein